MEKKPRFTVVHSRQFMGQMDVDLTGNEQPLTAGYKWSSQVVYGARSLCLSAVAVRKVEQDDRRKLEVIRLEEKCKK